MASATGIPERNGVVNGRAEDEPLLGSRGDVSQESNKPLWSNVFMGTAILAMPD